MIEAILESGFVYKSDLIGICISVIVVPSDNDFFNNTFKNRSIKFFKNLILSKSLSEAFYSLAKTIVSLYLLFIVFKLRLCFCIFNLIFSIH